MAAQRKSAQLDRKKLFSDPVMMGMIGVLLVFLVLFIVYPLFVLLIDSVYTEGAFTLDVFKRVLDMQRFRTAFTNTLELGVLTGVLSTVIGMLFAYPTSLVSLQDGEAIKSALSDEIFEETEELSLLERTVSVLTVDDFSKLLSRQNIVAIIVFSIMFGLAIRATGEKAKPVLNLLESLTEVIMSLLNIVMYYAPIGLGCYFAALIGTFGGSIAVGYLKTFVIYTIACLVCYFIVYSLYAFIAGGKKGFKVFWSSIIPATLTALATCSSAASIPVNLQAAKKIGVSDDIAETLIPLGTSFHKDGSIIGSVFKAMFLVCLFGTNVFTVGGFFQILVISLVATLFVTAVPIGGGTISETMIITMLGYPLGALPILTMIATIIDAPATVLNVVGDASSSMLAARIVDGKRWMDK